LGKPGGEPLACGFAFIYCQTGLDNYNFLQGNDFCFMSFQIELIFFIFFKTSKKERLPKFLFYAGM